MLRLGNTTLIAITTKDYLMQKYAISRCLSCCVFKNVVVFTDKPELFPEASEHVIIAKMSCSADVSIHNIITMTQNRHLYGDYTLNIHADSWIINPSAWTDDFYNCDYIGARWPTGEVGNDGFSFKSKKFWDELNLLQFDPRVECCHPADVMVSRRYRKHFEDRGLKWASLEIADKFSVEMDEMPFDHSFGFHGLFVLPKVMEREKNLFDGFVLDEKARGYVFESESGST